ncbi:hypothetical protein [Arcticibacterium luteifluviistationis]|uniref:Uncharacterized protein n=1 Tax=Arcticibacterium luteifluviistationis TaxID=1784714 RepID=A0A2Z4GH11_9BACT|nr:hypothetical protein [Arcticibacterium luteifluviistationis]AWW00482.1 hypothetical protein DJ013_20785 [Arcticibacterium luteifluviistationis]
MKSTLLTIAFLFTALIGFSQEKANYNTTRTNKVNGIVAKGDDKIILNIDTNNGRASEARIKSSIESQIKRQKVDLSSEDISQITEYITKVSSAVNSEGDNVQKLKIRIELRFKKFTIIITIG